MLTLTRKDGQRVLIGAIEVEVVEIRRDCVVLRVCGVEDESTIRLAETSHEDPSSRPPRPAPRRRAVVPSRQGAPVIIEKRRTRRES